MFDNFIDTDTNFLSDDGYEFENNSIFNNSFLTPQSNQLNDSEVQTVQKNKKIFKKDDFDYKKYIDNEMQKLNLDEIDPKVRKRMAQKIRNRMSAQRSRLRQKNKLKFLEDENKILKNRLVEQEKIIYYLQQKNQELEDKITNKDNTSTTTEQKFIDGSIDNNNSILKRFENQKKNSLSFSKSFLLICLIALFFQTDSNHVNFLFKQRDLFPMISTVKTKQLMVPQSKEVQEYPSRVNFRDVIPLVCYRQDIKQKQKYNLLMDSEDISNFEFNKNYFVSDIQQVEFDKQIL